MSSNTARFQELFFKWRTDQLDQDELEELYALLNQKNSGRFVTVMEQAWEEENLLTREDSGEVPGIVRMALNKSSSENLPGHPAIVHRVHFLRTAWFRWAAAVIILFGTGTYIFIRTSKTEAEVAQTTPSSVPVDVMPGSDKAILTLSDGRKITLDSTAAKTIAEGDLQIQNNNGQLSYQSATTSGSPVNSGNPGLNTMSTPKGGQYQLTLADGTKVWLNAASSITYPTAFTGKTREVYISGEAYFEVKANKTNPFIVKTNTETITVLGTAFNVNVYSDEPQSKISLLDGAVKVGDDILHPGQAWMNGKITKTNLDQDIAWKNGLFNYRNTDIKAITRQLEKWYDVEFIYPMNIDEQLNAKISRQTPLSEILRLLQLTNIVHFKIEGKKVTVTK